MEPEMIPPTYHGDNPNGPPSGGSYDPQYIAVVHLRSDGWNVNGIHAHFSAGGLDAGKRLALAAGLMEAKLKGGHATFDYPGAPEQPYIKPDGEPAQYVNFEQFGFGSQHDIYVFFEHAPGAVSFPATDIAEIPARFRSGKKGDANYAFYNTREVTKLLPPALAAQGSMVLMENHFTKRGAAPITKGEYFYYKICFLYTAASGIEMVIDPGGGNGITKP